MFFIRAELGPEAHSACPAVVPPTRGIRTEEIIFGSLRSGNGLVVRVSAERLAMFAVDTLMIYFFTSVNMKKALPWIAGFLVLLCAALLTRYTIVPGTIGKGGDRQGCFVMLDRWTGRTWIMCHDPISLSEHVYWWER